MIHPRILLVLLIVALCLLVLGTNTPPSPTGPGSIVNGAQMLEPRSGHTATLLPDGRVLITGGMRRNQDFYRSAELFEPATGKFSATGKMQIARVGHAAVLLRSGKVLIAGGWIGHGVTDEAELYDPATGKFTVIGHMLTGRGRPEATLLRDGNVLITGGGGDNDGGGSSITNAEIFDVSTSKFSETGAMRYARIAHTATLLADGRVLIAARYKHTAGLLPDGRVLIAGGSDDRDWQCGNL